MNKTPLPYRLILHRLVTMYPYHHSGSAAYHPYPTPSHPSRYPLVPWSSHHRGQQDVHVAEGGRRGSSSTWTSAPPPIRDPSPHPDLMHYRALQSYPTPSCDRYYRHPSSTARLSLPPSSESSSLQISPPHEPHYWDPSNFMISQSYRTAMSATPLAPPPLQNHQPNTASSVHNRRTSAPFSTLISDMLPQVTTEKKKAPSVSSNILLGKSPTTMTFERILECGTATIR